MFEKPSLILRITIGKTVGFAFGLLGFFLAPMFWPEIEPTLRWAILLWYATFGAVIAVFGVFTYHPVLHLPMPWWFRSCWVGGWLNLVLMLFIYDKLEIMMAGFFGESSAFNTPWMIVLEGMLVGLLIGFLATKYGGEGKETVGR
jgi:hypothetical protein